MAPGTQALSSGLFMHLPPPPLHRTPNCTYARNKRPCCPSGLRPQAALAPLVCRALAFYPFLQHCPVIRHSFAERASSCLPLPKPFLSFPMASLPFHGRAGCCTYLHLRPIKHSSYCILLGCIPTLPQMSCKCRLTCKYRALSMRVLRDVLERRVGAHDAPLAIITATAGRASAALASAGDAPMCRWSVP